MADGSPFSTVAGGVSLSVCLTPKACANRIGPVVTDTDGGAVLKVAVNQPPVEGKANTALIRLLAKSWGLPKTAISVKKGASGRLKTLFIEGDPERLMKRMPKNL